MAVNEEELKERRIYEVFRDLPLFTDVPLFMQAQSLDLVDGYIEQIEEALLAEYIEMERTPGPTTMYVLAHSQLWVFGLYELLRTWRQLGRDVVSYGQSMADADAEAREVLREEKKAEMEKRNSLHPFPGSSFSRHYQRAEEDPNFLARLKKAYDVVQPLFRRVEALRISLAKHEIAKTKGMKAPMPTHARIDLSNGSLYWQVFGKNDTVEIISRRSLADAIRELDIAACAETWS